MLSMSKNTSTGDEIDIDIESEVLRLMPRMEDLQEWNNIDPPLAHRLAALGLVNPLEVAIEEHKDEVLRTAVDGDGNTLFHAIVVHSPDDALEALLEVVSNLLWDEDSFSYFELYLKHENNSGDDVVNAASRHGRLNLFLKHIRSFSYWEGEMGGPIELRVKPQRDAWVALGDTN